MEKVIFLLNHKNDLLQEALTEKWKAFFEEKEREVHIRYLYEEEPLPEVVQWAEAMKPDLLIGFDMGGFEVSLYGEDIFFNKYRFPCIHFLTRPCTEQEVEVLKGRLNVTFLFFTNVRENADKIQSLRFPPYIEYVEDLSAFWTKTDVRKCLETGYDR